MTSSQYRYFAFVDAVRRQGRAWSLGDDSWFTVSDTRIGTAIPLWPNASAAEEYAHSQRLSLAPRQLDIDCVDGSALSLDALPARYTLVNPSVNDSGLIVPLNDLADDICAGTTDRHKGYGIRTISPSAVRAEKLDLKMAENRSHRWLEDFRARLAALGISVRDADVIPPPRTRLLQKDFDAVMWCDPAVAWDGWSAERESAALAALRRAVVRIPRAQMILLPDDRDACHALLLPRLVAAGHTRAFWEISGEFALRFCTDDLSAGAALFCWPGAREVIEVSPIMGHRLRRISYQGIWTFGDFCDRMHASRHGFSFLRWLVR